MTNAEKVEAWRKWLQARQIEFQEHANGHFRVFRRGEFVLEFWATKHKFRVDGDANYQVGEHLIRTAIIRAYGPK